jgi:hypothetical protein
MAAKKKTKKKTAKKAGASTKAATKAPVRAQKTPARAKKAAPRLTAEEKLAKLKPGDDLDELVDEVLTAWSRVGKRVRVADVTPASLRSLMSKADRTARRESELAAKQAAKLAPLSDARLVAMDAAYRAALKVKRIADAITTADTEVAEAFASVTERFRRAPSKDEPATPAS